MLLHRTAGVARFELATNGLSSSDGFRPHYSIIQRKYSFQWITLYQSAALPLRHTPKINRYYNPTVNRTNLRFGRPRLICMRESEASFPKPVHRNKTVTTKSTTSSVHNYLPKEYTLLYFNPKLTLWEWLCTRYGIRIRVAGMKILSPRPLDEPSFY